VPNHDRYEDADLRDILARVKTIAVVGASENPARPSYGVMRYLAARGYRVLAVNPKLAADAIAGIPVYPSLAEVPEPIDMVDVFRNNAAVDGVVDEVLALPRLPSVIWMQLGVRVDAAAERAEARGIQVVMNRCPKIDYHRLFPNQ
jgi:predicted CoA-binding protein